MTRRKFRQDLGNGKVRVVTFVMNTARVYRARCRWKHGRGGTSGKAGCRGRTAIEKVGIRTQAVGVKSWLTFVRHSRAFFIEERAKGLVLEEWPKDGGSFSATASWRKVFPSGDLGAAAAHLVAVASVYLCKGRWAVPSRCYFVKWLETDIAPVAILEANDLSGLNKAVSTVLEASLRLIGTTERSRGNYASGCVSAALELATNEELVRAGRMFRIERRENDLVLSEYGLFVTTQGRRKTYDFAGAPIWEKRFSG